MNAPAFAFLPVVVDGFVKREQEESKVSNDVFACSNMEGTTSARRSAARKCQQLSHNLEWVELFTLLV